MLIPMDLIILVYLSINKNNNFFSFFSLDYSLITKPYKMDLGSNFSEQIALFWHLWINHLELLNLKPSPLSLSFQLFSSVGGKDLLLYLITFFPNLNANGIYKNLHQKVINAVKKLNISPIVRHSKAVL